MLADKGQEERVEDLFKVGDADEGRSVLLLKLKRGPELEEPNLLLSSPIHANINRQEHEPHLILVKGNQSSPWLQSAWLLLCHGQDSHFTLSSCSDYGCSHQLPPASFAMPRPKGLLRQSLAY